LVYMLCKCGRPLALQPPPLLSTFVRILA